MRGLSDVTEAVIQVNDFGHCERFFSVDSVMRAGTAEKESVCENKSLLKCGYWCMKSQ